MIRPLDRLLLEAGCAAANYDSVAHRTTAAREVLQIDLGALVGNDDGMSHLGLAIREVTISLAGLSTDRARAAAAEGLACLVRAARAQPTTLARPPARAPRPYWIERESS